MDTDISGNLQTVKELILDEEKIVTYISLSKELCIHVNEAKSLLCQVVKDLRNSKPETEVFVCYLISGLQNNNSACTTVCSEKDLEALKKTLKIVFYEHVYCVSRGLKFVDNVALSAINKFEDLPLCTGLIRANACTKRPPDEIGNLINHAAVKESKPISAPQKPIKDVGKELIKNGHADVKKVTEVKSEPKIKSEIPSPKKDTSSNVKTSVAKNGNKGSSKSIAGFFNKANSNSKPQKLNTVKVATQEIETTVKQEVKEEPMDTDKNEAVNTEKPEPVKNLKDTATTNKKNGISQIKKNAKVDKKRKRLLHVSDSESDTEVNDPFKEDMAVDNESEDEIPPTPTINTVKITSGIVNPKKRRKIVDKTYTDEDGYILTKKEEVYESCSENEDETKENVKDDKENTKEIAKQEKIQVKTEVSPKENIKGRKKKVSPPQKGKQSTLTNFFKKV